MTKQWQLRAAGLVLALAASAASHAQILIGQTAGFSGQVAAGVKETTDGALLYIDAINAKGGVNGQKIELISLDDKFDPKLAAENARTLIEDKNVLALFLNRGTPHTEAILPLLDKHGVVLVAPSTGAMVLHQPVRKYIFNVRATYQREAEKAITHLASMGISRVALVYADDSFGADGIQGAQKGLAAAKLTAVVSEKFDRAKPDFAPIAAKVAKADAQAVLMVASGSAVVDATNALRTAGSAAQIVTLSNNASSGFIKSLGANAPGRDRDPSVPQRTGRDLPDGEGGPGAGQDQGTHRDQPRHAGGLCRRQGAGRRPQARGPQAHPRQDPDRAGKHQEAGPGRAGGELQPR